MKKDFLINAIEFLEKAKDEIYSIQISSSTEDDEDDEFYSEMESNIQVLIDELTEKKDELVE